MEQKIGVGNTALGSGQPAGGHHGSEGKGFPPQVTEDRRGVARWGPGTALREAMNGGLIVEAESVGGENRGTEGGERWGDGGGGLQFTVQVNSGTDFGACAGTPSC